MWRRHRRFSRFFFLVRPTTIPDRRVSRIVSGGEEYSKNGHFGGVFVKFKGVNDGIMTGAVEPS